MSPKLRDKIRREAYITNEIIIQHEAQRACKLPADEVDHVERRVADESNSANRWNRVLKGPLSAFDFDLEVHGTPMSPPVMTSNVGPVEL